MSKFRKKPIVIEAWQFTKENFTKSKEPNWLKEAIINKKIAIWSQWGGDLIEGEISTLEGTMIVSENDWIIKGVNGEFYPCKPDIFEKTYEPAIYEILNDYPTKKDKKERLREKLINYINKILK